MPECVQCGNSFERLFLKGPIPIICSSKCEKRRYYLRHQEQENLRIKLWTKRNPEKKRRAVQNWISKNLEKQREIKRILENRRRARVKGNGVIPYSQGEWEVLKTIYGNICLACGLKETEDSKLTADHILPITLGGQDSLENLQPLCKSCNSKKYNKFIDYRGEYALRLV